MGSGTKSTSQAGLHPRPTLYRTNTKITSAQTATAMWRLSQFTCKLKGAKQSIIPVLLLTYIQCFPHIIPPTNYIWWLHFIWKNSTTISLLVENTLENSENVAVANSLSCLMFFLQLAIIVLTYYYLATSPREDCVPWSDLL